MKNRPRVSICVPVYNNAPYLESFLDSALQQSLDDYEIVLVDNCSSDDSMEILKKYQAAFPEKVFVYQTKENRGAASGRNLAFQRSRGDYIYHCDSDDLIHPCALEKLYYAALEDDADLVIGSAYEVIEREGEILSIKRILNKKNGIVDNNIAIMHGVDFWARLIRRDLAEQVGPMPENHIYEDVRYLTVLHSFASKIRFLDYPVYYWFKRGDSTTTKVRKELCEDSIDAGDYILRHSNPNYIEAVQLLAARRNRDAVGFRWEYYDLYVKKIHEDGAWFYNNPLIRNDKRLIEDLHRLDARYSIELPNIIYVNGFNGAPSAERLEELREKVFHDGCEIVILSEKNCDFKENPYVQEAYQRGEISVVCGYFALKRIYEAGGVFLHDNIRILNPFGFLKYQNAFFSLVDKNTFSEWIFGAPAGNEAIKAIMETYDDTWNKKGEYMPLAERIKIILTAKYGIPLDGKERQFGEVVSVLSPEYAVDTRYGSAYKRCAYEHDFSSFAGEENYVTLPRSTLEMLIARRIIVKKDDRAVRELATLKKTNTYRWMMKIRAIGDGKHGAFLKKVYRRIKGIKNCLYKVHRRMK